MTKAEVIQNMREAHNRLHELIVQAEATPEEDFKQISMGLEGIRDDLLDPAKDEAWWIADNAVDTAIAADAASINMDEEPGRPKSRPQGAFRADDFA